MHETLALPNLSHMDFLGHLAATTTCNDPISCTTHSAVPNQLSNLEILMKNNHKITYSFLGSRPAINPAEYYFSCACIVLLSEASSSSHVLHLIARQRGPLGPGGSIWPRQTCPNHEILQNHHHGKSLSHLVLSPVDFPDDPVAIH